MQASIARVLGAVTAMIILLPAHSVAQVPRDTTARRDTSTKIEIYGFTQGDGIYDFRQNNQDWFDVNRPSKLPAFKDEFGKNYRTWLSARQTKIGVKAKVPTKSKDITVHFEWDLFGVGIDAGQTTIRPRLMYGQWGKFGVGQLWSPFMDNDVFPNILEYWGPNGMVFFRNVQFFWEPIRIDSGPQKGTKVRFAVERPGATGDAGIFADRIELQSIIPRFPFPDLSGEIKITGKYGYAKLSGLARWMRWDDQLVDTFDLSGGTNAWGVTLSGNVYPSEKNVLRLQVVYGRGVENYFNDAPVDVGIKRVPFDVRRPIIGVALPDFGAVAYLDHRWTKHFTSAVGYSRVFIQNSDAQAPSAFRVGQYASTNLLWTPVPNVTIGGEFQWGYRRNFSDGFSVDDYRLQFAGRYNYSQTFGGK